MGTCRDTNMVLSIEDLPNELLINILTRVRNGSGKYLSSLLCCRKWHDVGLPIFFHDVALRLFKSFDFSRRSSVFHHVHSLTVQIPSTAEDFPLPQSAAEDEAISHRYAYHMATLASVVKHMANLKTVSLKANGRDESPWLHDKASWLQQRAIDGFIEALPESVVNLEVDTFAAEEPILVEVDSPGLQRSESSCHLCGTLSKLIPRLQHLRIRLYSVCPALLASLSSDGCTSPNDAQVLYTKARSSLKSLSIVFHSLPLSATSRNCVISGTQPRIDPRRVRNAVSSRLSASKLYDLYEADVFPNMKACKMIGLQKRGLEHDAFVVRDIIHHETITIPFRRFGGSDDRWFFIRSPPDKELLSSSIDDLATIVEEDVAWVESVSGCRFPHAIKAAKEVDEAAYAFKESALLDRQSFRMRSRRSCELWMKEELVGRCLLEGVAEPKLQGTKPVEELPSGLQISGSW